MPASLEHACAISQVAQYVDGELDHNAEVMFERHLAECFDCREEVRAQRLFACELDAALNQSFELEVPKDFSRHVAARATSDMSGVRSFAEHRKALGISLTLAVVGFALVGTTARDSLLVIGRKVIGGIWGVLSLISVAVYDLGVSFAVIVRVVSRKFVIETGSSGYLLVVFALAVFLLSRLIFKYHRSGAH